MSASEDAARLEGFADCESLIGAMLSKLAFQEDKKAAIFKPGEQETRHRERAMAIREISLALMVGQHRTDAYDPEDIAKAHRKASTSPGMARKGGKARAEALTPEERSRIASAGGRAAAKASRTKDPATGRFTGRPK